GEIARGESPSGRAGSRGLRLLCSRCSRMRRPTSSRTASLALAGRRGDAGFVAIPADITPRRSRLLDTGTDDGTRLTSALMPEGEFRHAVRDALDEELERDPKVVFFGEDVAVAGGVFAATPGLYEKYGPERVFDTPISELVLAGAAFGSAVAG